jgi:two-component system CheB/CheR fusion protein
MDQQSEATPEEPKTQGFALVGIGASAGGLAALKRFFQHVPANSGLTFVVIVHLSAEHESHLPSLLQPHVRMPVVQVTETTQIERDRVYVIPPGCNLATVDSHLHLSALEESRRDRAPIDHFLRTLAKTFDGVSIGVILTGTGSDGTLGIKEIKQVGGLTIAQEPNEAEYDGMPQSAIATGLVDLVLPLAEIPGAILRYVRTRPSISVPDDGDDVGNEERQLLHKLFTQVRGRTGRDFSRYKRSTIMRRIQRRMQLHQIEKLEDYLTYVRLQPEEARALADEFLVTVTNFFRDPEVFRALETHVIPRLFDEKRAGDALRVWSVGCATGEEAYSLAILLSEEAARREQSTKVQVFASDLHDRSLRSAREGLYSGNIDADVSPERLAQFFTKQSGGYRVRQELRELVVFAAHNLLADPPFSRIDLIACRNLLIYLQRDVQRDVVELFHYALRPEGVLMLGTSETVGRSDLFRLEDKKHCFYRKRNVPTREPSLPVFTLTNGAARLPQLVRAQPSADPPLSYALLHAQMLDRHAPPSLLINQDHNVMHLSADAGQYMRVPGGDPTSNLFKLVREELRLELRATLHGAQKDRRPVRSKPIELELDGERPRVVVVVSPAEAPQHEGFSLVVFEPQLEPMSAAEAGVIDVDASTRDLRMELELTRQRVQSLIEKYETSQEEMKATNEELQSANEELRSTMEELETSKEELQSMNEELTTLNQENRHKVEELSQLSSDLQNLMAATDIATLFLDRDLRILRFTPQVGELFNVRPTDRGRPLTDLTHRLGYDDIAADARRVLDKLTPIEHEVQDQGGHWYLARVLPYRSTHDRIGGVVITFIEITERKRAEQSLRQSAEANAFRLALSDAVRPLADPLEVETSAVWMLGERFAADRVFHVELAEDGTFGRVRTTFGGTKMGSEYRFEEHGQALMNELRAGQTVVVANVDTDPRLGAAERERASEREVRAFISVPLRDGSRLESVLLVQQAELRTWTPETVTLIEETAERMRTLSQRMKALTALRESEARYRAIVEQSVVGVVICDLDGRITFVNARQAEIVGYGVDELIGVNMLELTHADDRERNRELFARLTATGKPYVLEERYLRKQGGEVWAYVTAMPILDAEGKPRAVVVLSVDIDERKRAEQAVNEADRRKDEFLATLAHELRNPLAPIANALTMLRQPNPGQVDELLAIIDRQVNHMIRLVEDLLDVSRITRGVIELRKQHIDLVQVVRDAVETSRPLLDEGDRHLSVELADEAMVVYGDHARLLQVVANLLNNAARCTHEGGQIRLTLTRDGERARVSVRDDGIGIAADMLGRVFDMFVQVDPSHSHGLGVGLTLVRNLVAMHGGSVEVHSAGVGCGSEFIVVLPLVRERVSVPAQEPGLAPKRVADGYRALVVDDNRDAADTLAMLLASLGVQVEVTYDGPSALAIVQNWTTGLLFLDLGMPEMDGYQLARAIRDLPGPRSLTLIALTGWGQQEDRQRTTAAGFHKHLLKPVPVHALSQLLVELTTSPSAPEGDEPAELRD